MNLVKNIDLDIISKRMRIMRKTAPDSPYKYNDLILTWNKWTFEVDRLFRMSPHGDRWVEYILKAPFNGRTIDVGFVYDRCLQTRFSTK